MKQKTLCGVYKLTNKSTGDFYIGSSRDLTRRKNIHLNAIKARTHRNKTIREDSLLFNETNFEFEVLEYCKNYELKDREYHYIFELNPKYNKNFPSGSEKKETHRISMHMPNELFKDLQKICTQRKLSITSYMIRSLVSRLRLESIISGNDCVCVCKCKKHSQG